MKGIIALVVSANLMFVPVAHAYSFKDASCDELVNNLRADTFRVQKTQQHIKEVVTDKAKKEKALNVAARSLRGIDKLIKLTLMVKQNGKDEGWHLAKHRELEEVVSDIMHGKGDWHDNYVDLRTMSIDLMQQDYAEIRDITGITANI